MYSMVRILLYGRYSFQPSALTILLSIPLLERVATDLLNKYVTFMQNIVDNQESIEFIVKIQNICNLIS